MSSVMAESGELGILDRTLTHKSFWRAFERVIARYDLDFFIFLWLRHDGSLFLQTNLPAHAYGGASRDPFLKYCCNTMGITFVGADYPARRAIMTPDEDRYVLQAANAGWRSGVAMPVKVKRHRDYGGFNLGSRLDGAAFKTAIGPHLDRVQAICLFAYQRMHDMGWLNETPDRGQVSESLTPRQQEIHALLREGFTRAEISRRTGISGQTVATHQRAIYKKLGVHSQRELMRRTR